MWLGKLVSSPLVTCCGTGISDSAVAAFTRLLNDWITRGFVTPTGGDTLPRLPGSPLSRDTSLDHCCRQPPPCDTKLRRSRLTRPLPWHSPYFAVPRLIKIH